MADKVDKIDKAEKMYKDCKGKRVVCECTHVWQVGQWPELNDADFIGNEAYEHCSKCGLKPWVYNRRGAFQKYKRRDV